MVVVDIHDFLFVCIGDGGCPERSSSIRTRATVVEVTGWRFTFLSKDPPNLSIRWETHRKRGGPARSSSMRTRAIMAEVTGWRFTFSSWDPPNFSIRWETHWKRITSVSPTSTDRNTTTVRLKFNPTTPTPADCIACATSNGDIEER